MKINSRVLTGCGALISLGLAPIFINYATSQPPQWAKDNPALVWLVAILLVVMGVSLGFVSVTSGEGGQQPDLSELGPTRDEVNGILETLNNYPQKNLRIPPDLDELLENSRSYAKTLVRIYDRAKKERNRVGNDMADLCIALLSKLIGATSIYFSLKEEEKKKYLVEMASQAYKIRKAQNKWAYASEMAYQVAKANYEISDIQACQTWINDLERCVQRTVGDAKHDELKAMLCEMQGLSISQSREEDAKRLFEQALRLTRDLAMRCRITFHSAEIERMQMNAAAISKYKNVLNETKDMTLKMECYDRLGRIAFKDGDLDTASSYHENQRQLAAECNQLGFLKRARQELVEILERKSPPDYEEAYRNASKALKLEKLLSGSVPHAMHHKAVGLADTILGVQTPPY